MLSKGDNVEVRSWIKAAMMCELSVYRCPIRVCASNVRAWLRQALTLVSDIAYGGGKELFMRKFGQDFSMVAGNVAASISL